MKRRVEKVLIFLVTLMASGVAYVVFYIFVGFGIPCPFHLVTGLRCPGCGITRMVVSLVHFDFELAFHYNAALFVALPVFLVLAISIIVGYIKTGSQKLSRWQSIVVISLIVILLLFGVIRNLPVINEYI